MKSGLFRKLNRQQERMNQASLLVIYLTENARNDEPTLPREPTT